MAVGEDDAVHNVAKVNERGESYKQLYEGENIVDVPRSLLRHSSAILRLRGRLAFNDLITVLLPFQGIEYVVMEIHRLVTGEKRLGPLSRLAAKYVVGVRALILACLLYTSPSPRDQRGSRMPSSA